MSTVWIKKAGFYFTVLARNLLRGRRPYKAILILTWKCQARCMMCEIWKRKPGDELTLTEWSSFFEKNPFLRWLTLSGGEPFLRTDLVEIAEAALRHCPNLFYINTPTNSLAPEKILETVGRLLKLNIPMYVLSISLDGPPDVHNRVRGISTAWDRAMTVLGSVRELEKKYPHRFQVLIEHTLLPPAYGRFTEMVDAVRQKFPDINAADFMVAGPNVSQHYYGNAAAVGELKSSKEEMDKALLQIIEARSARRRLSLNYLVPQLYLELYRGYATSRIPPMHCRAARSSVFIDPEGIVYPCNGWNRELGQLRESGFSLENILNRPETRTLRKDIDRFKCGGCWTPCEASVSIGETALHPRTLCQLVEQARSGQCVGRVRDKF